MSYNTDSMDKVDTGIEVNRCEVIELDFPTFTLEYNHTFKLYSAIPDNTEKYDHNIILEGTVNELENDKTTTYIFDRDMDIFDYVLSVKEFEEIKKEMKELFTF